MTNLVEKSIACSRPAQRGHLQELTLRNPGRHRRCASELECRAPGPGTGSKTVPTTACEFQVYAIEARHAIQSLEILPDFPDIQRFLDHHLFDLRDWQLAVPVISCLSPTAS